MQKKKICILLIVIIVLVGIKCWSLPGDIEKVKEQSESDLVHYLRISRWFTGEQTDEPARTYQYPPFFSILLIPALYTDAIAYVLILNVILSILCFFPLYLISRRFTGFYQSVFLTSLVLIFNMVFSIKSYGYPMILSTLFFAWFIYFFIDARQDRRCFYLASLSFGLLIFTKYVFFFLLPMIVIWLYLDKVKDVVSRLKSILLFGIMPAVFFLSWSIRNILLHGLSIEGSVGGYVSLTRSNHFFSIHFDTIPSKLMSIVTHLEPNTMMTYFLLFVFGLILIYIKQKKIDDFRWLLLFNFILFFCIPAMTYNLFYLNWRYLSTMTPVYLLFGLIPIINSLRIRRR